jgi:hypothetical protein
MHLLACSGQQQHRHTHRQLPSFLLFGEWIVVLVESNSPAITLLETTMPVLTLPFILSLVHVSRG